MGMRIYAQGGRLASGQVDKLDPIEMDTLREEREYKILWLALRLWL